VIPSEITDYFTAGTSVIIYNHRCREQDTVYLQRFNWMHKDSNLKNEVITGLTFKRGTIRDYIFALHPSHAPRIMKCMDNMLQSPWRNHFAKLDFAL